MTTSSIQSAIEQTSGTATYIGGAATVLWGLTADEWTAIGIVFGILFTASTFAVNWYYRHKSWKYLHNKGK